MNLWKYHPDPRIPGVTLARLSFNNPDAAAEGRALAEEMKRRPERERGVLITDLGGGSSKDEFHLWTRADREPLTVEQAQEVYIRGVRAGARQKCLDWMQNAMEAYRQSGGPTLEMLAANVETFPGMDCRTVATFEQVKSWRVTTDPDDIQSWGAEVSSQIVWDLLRSIPRRREYNLGAVHPAPNLFDRNGRRVGPFFPYPAPFLYLTEAHRHQAATNPDSVLANYLHIWERLRRTETCAVLAPPLWAGEGDKSMAVPVMRRVFTFPSGERRMFYSKRDKPAWFAAWSALYRVVGREAADVVFWCNDGRFFGPAPTDAECAVMRKAVEEAV